MNVPKVDIKQLLEAGVHLGHKTLRWNPKMKRYIFGEKNSIHIIDLTQTVDFIKNALVQVHKVVASGGKQRNAPVHKPPLLGLTIRICARLQQEAHHLSWLT